MIKLESNLRKILFKAYLEEDGHEKYNKSPFEDDYVKRFNFIFDAIPDLVKDLKVYFKLSTRKWLNGNIYHEYWDKCRETFEA